MIKWKIWIMWGVYVRKEYLIFMIFSLEEDFNLVMMNKIKVMKLSCLFLKKKLIGKYMLFLFVDI